MWESIRGFCSYCMTAARRRFRTDAMLRWFRCDNIDNCKVYCFAVAAKKETWSWNCQFQLHWWLRTFSAVHFVGLQHKSQMLNPFAVMIYWATAIWARWNGFVFIPNTSKLSPLIPTQFWCRNQKIWGKRILILKSTGKWKSQRMDGVWWIMIFN